MKKLISLLMVLSLLLGVCACAAAEEKTYRVAILQLVQHEALDAVTRLSLITRTLPATSRPARPLPASSPPVTT